jgi:hypothetical protein
MRPSVCTAPENSPKQRHIPTSRAFRRKLRADDQHVTAATGKSGAVEAPGQSSAGRPHQQRRRRTNWGTCKVLQKQDTPLDEFAQGPPKKRALTRSLRNLTLVREMGQGKSGASRPAAFERVGWRRSSCRTGETS